MNKTITDIRRVLALFSAEYIDTVDILSGGNFYVVALSGKN